MTESRQVSAGSPPPGPGRNPAPLWVFGIALAIRALYVADIHDTVLVRYLLIDSDTYDRFAHRILAGTFRGEDVYSMNLLYPYFLAGLYALGDGSRVVVLAVQAVLGAGSAALVAWLGAALFRPAVGWVAGIGAALYGPAVFYTGALLTPTLIDCFGLVMLVLLVQWRNRWHAGWLWGAGLCLGAATLGRGNALLFLPLSVLFFRSVRPERSQWIRAVGLFAAAAALLPALATLRNALVEGHLVPVSANYAAFYIGHNEQATGLYRMPEFVSSADFEGEVTGAREALSEEMGRELTQAEVSNVLFRRGWSYALTHPLEELRLAGAKLYFLFNRTESPTNLNLYFAREFSPVLRALPLGMGVVAPLGLAGLVWTWRRRRELLLLYLYGLVFVTTAVLFFVSAEYRMPLVWVLILFAGETLVRIAGVVRRPAAAAERRRVWMVLALLPVLFVVCNLRTPLLRAQSLLRVDHYNFATLARNAGDPEQAEVLYRRSLQIDPAFLPARNGLAELERRRAGVGTGGVETAAAHFREGRYAEALTIFEELLLTEQDPRARIGLQNNTGLCRYYLGGVVEAEVIFRNLTRRHPGYVPAWNNLGLALVALERLEEARAAYSRALELDPDNPKARRGLEKLAPVLQERP